jgi:hypothetical protein
MAPPHAERRGFGCVGAITPLVDLWVEERRLPKYMRMVAKRLG